MTKVRPDQLWERKVSVGTASRVIVLETVAEKVTYRSLRRPDNHCVTISKKTFKSIYRKVKSS